MGSLLSRPARPSGVSRGVQTEWNCPACYSGDRNTVTMPCGHELCLSCLLRQSVTSPTCPQCGSPVLSGRFSVLSHNDFMQCLLIPPGTPRMPRGWAQRGLFRLVRTGPPAPAEPPSAGLWTPEMLSPELWAELLRRDKHLLGPVRVWLRNCLDAIYGPQWWEARQVESIALSTLCICGPDRDELIHMLQGYLREYTAPLVYGLLHITVERCRDACLRRGFQAAPAEEQQGDEEQGSYADSAGPSWLGENRDLGLGPDPAGPGLGEEPSEPRPSSSSGSDSPPAAVFRPPVCQHCARPQEDDSAPGPSAPWRERNRQPRPRSRSRSRSPSPSRSRSRSRSPPQATRHSQRGRDKSRRPSTVWRKPRRK